MIHLRIALTGMLAAIVISTPSNHNRQDGQQIIFRSDLKQGHASRNVTGHCDITFVDQPEKVSTDRSIVEPRSIPLSVGNRTLYINMGTDEGDPTGPQPVSLDAKQQSAGWFYTVGGESN
ncbi:hypothetical protein IMSHALPRED_000691 [Imshaugia aleurites]|uniref:Uncharacterized protein n=1 Tax=Imshaugia aleurites TaxID=172621 RepID=A0A8H3IXS9_9LECA|nr:hypothetical protein IMSHALPRED_000691 [Imshaugia aleurites]